jgi:hypothetical protein
MDPNSQHQLWSRWIFHVFPHRLVSQRQFQDVRDNCARFARRMFGSAGQMRVEYKKLQFRRAGHESRQRYGWLVEMRVEGHPAHDQDFTTQMCAKWQRFFENGFGAGTFIWFRVYVEAGDKQDGKPPDQLIIVPPLAVPHP